VNISVVKQVTTFSFEGPGGMVPGNPFGGGPSLDDPSRLREFLEKFHVAPKKRRLPVGVGSGFIISPEGHVVTNAHVVEGAHEVIVTLSDRSEMRAKVIGMDTNFDLALLKMTHDKPLPYVQWGDAKKMRIGDWAIAIGNPLGLGGSVTLGIISYVGRSFISQQNSMGGLFQTDAAINMGNSGGPLFNVEGQVIGINMMIASATGPIIEAPTACSARAAISATMVGARLHSSEPSMKIARPIWRILRRPNLSAAAPPSSCSV
jgi:serine protease Do